MIAHNRNVSRKRRIPRRILMYHINVGYVGFTKCFILTSLHLADILYISHMCRCLWQFRCALIFLVKLVRRYMRIFTRHCSPHAGPTRSTMLQFDYWNVRYSAQRFANVVNGVAWYWSAHDMINFGKFIYFPYHAQASGGENLTTEWQRLTLFYTSLGANRFYTQLVMGSII